MARLFVPGMIVAVVLVSGCGASPPETFLRTYDEPGTWKTVGIRQALGKDKIWRVLVDTLSQKYDLEVLEKDSGYLRTSWKYTLIVNEEISSRYRSRVVVKILGEPWTKAQVKIETHWLGKKGWLTGFDTRLLEDIYGDIQGKLGRVRR